MVSEQVCLQTKLNKIYPNKTNKSYPNLKVSYNYESKQSEVRKG